MATLLEKTLRRGSEEEASNQEVQGLRQTS
jgi:hypothetical protein